MSHFTGIIGIFITVVKKFTARMLYGHEHT